jgi:type IV pilus assembly protein PilM
MKIKLKNIFQLKKVDPKFTFQLITNTQISSELFLPIGIDFGITAIKLCVIGMVNGVPQIVKLIIEELPIELWNNRLQRKTAIPEILKKIVKENDLEGKAISAISASALQIRAMKLPPMPEEDVTAAVKWELKQISAADIADMAFDHYSSRESHQSAQPQELLVVSCAKQEVFDQTSLLQTTGLQPIAVDGDIFAAVAVAEYNGQFTKEDIVLFLETGQQSSSISVVVHGKVQFKRDLAVNGDSLTRAISEHSRVSYEDAEQRKKKYGLLKRDNDAKKITGKEQYASEAAIIVNEALWLHLENLIQEIDYTFKYFSHQLSEGQIKNFDKIILSGGSANLKNFAYFLNSYLRVPVDIVDPFKKISLTKENALKIGSLETAAPRLAVAVGLALAGLDKKYAAY